MAVPVLVAMPDLRGRTPAAAEVVLGAIGLELAPEPHPTQESSASYGTIVAQTPEPEAETPVGTTVEITLATPWTVEVPDLSGATLDDATKTLAQAAAGLVDLLDLPLALAGLTLGAVGERVDPAAVGTILEQSPAAGSRAWLYGTVDVVVVSPVAGAAVPDLARARRSRPRSRRSQPPASRRAPSRSGRPTSARDGRRPGAGRGPRVDARRPRQLHRSPPPGRSRFPTSPATRSTPRPR